MSPRVRKGILHVANFSKSSANYFKPKGRLRQLEASVTESPNQFMHVTVPGLSTASAGISLRVGPW